MKFILLFIVDMKMKGAARVKLLTPMWSPIPSSDILTEKKSNSAILLRIIGDSRTCIVSEVNPDF